MFVFNSVHADDVFYSEYTPHNGSLSINHELENHTTLQIKYIQLLSKYPEFKLYSIRNRTEKKTNDLIGNSTLTVVNSTQENIKQYMRAIEELEIKQSNMSKELEKANLMLNESNGNLKRVRSDLAACITISSGFQDDYNQLSTKYAELKLAVPFNSTSVSSSHFLWLQWNYTSCIQELNRCKKKTNSVLFE